MRGGFLQPKTAAGTGGSSGESKTRISAVPGAVVTLEASSSSTDFQLVDLTEFPAVLTLCNIGTVNARVYNTTAVLTTVFPNYCKRVTWVNGLWYPPSY